MQSRSLVLGTFLAPPIERISDEYIRRALSRRTIGRTQGDRVLFYRRLVLVYGRFIDLLRLVDVGNLSAVRLDKLLRG